MSADGSENVEETSSGASATYPTQCGNLRKGGHVMIKDKPCKIVEIKVSKVGKHGHAKAHIVGIDIFTDKKYEENHPTSHTVNVPRVKRQEYQVIDFDGEYVEVLDDKGVQKLIKFDEKQCNHGKATDLQDESVTYFVTVLSALDTEAIKEIRKAND